MAIYNDVSGVPGTLVASTGTGVVGTGTIVLSVITPTLIPAGTYWIMAVYQNTGNHTWGTATSWSQTISYVALTFGSPAPTTASWLTYTGADFNYWAVSGNMSVSGPTAICAGSSATFAASGATSYAWSTGATSSSIVVSPATNTVYTVNGSGGTCSVSTTFSLTVNNSPTLSVTGPSTLCAGSSATLMASGATNYTWTNVPGNGTVVVIPNANTVYTVTGSSNGCSSTTTKTISVTPIPFLTLSGSNTVCAGSLITQTVSGSALTYTWNNNSNSTSTSMSPLTNTFFMVTGTGIGGCTNTAVQSIGVQSLPQISVNNGSICAGSAFTLQPIGANIYSYPAGGPVVSPLSSTSIPVVGTSISSGCSNTVMSNITVVQRPPVTLNSGSICTGASFTLVPSGAFTYTFAGGSSVVSPVVTSTYAVSGTGSGGCVNAAISTVTVNPLPVITAISNPTSFCKGQTATITLTGASTYSLNTTSTNPVFTVKPNSTLTYTLNGVDNNGCTNKLLYNFVVNACTGLKDENFAASGSLYIYPSPALNSVTVLLPQPGLITIYNSLGQLVRQQLVDETRIELNLDGLAEGTYHLQLVTAGEKYSTRLIKKN
jgi:hypothetical protein